MAGRRRGRGRERQAEAPLSVEPDLELSPATRQIVTGATITGWTPNRQSHPGAPAFLSLEGGPESGRQPVCICCCCVRSHYRLSGRQCLLCPRFRGSGIPVQRSWLSRSGSLRPQSDCRPGPWTCLSRDRLCLQAHAWGCWHGDVSRWLLPGGHSTFFLAAGGVTGRRPESLPPSRRSLRGE